MLPVLSKKYIEFKKSNTGWSVISVTHHRYTYLHLSYIFKKQNKYLVITSYFGLTVYNVKVYTLMLHNYEFYTKWAL
jgi:hypothetical protein